MCDTKGVIYEGRTEHMNAYKARFAAKTAARTLEEALVGADVFFGLSSGGCVTADMVRGMAPEPDHFRAGQSRSGDQLRRCPRRAARRDRGHRALATIPTR